MDIAQVLPDRAARLLTQLPSQSRIVRILAPENNWDWNELILSKILYAVDGLLWHKNNAGQKPSKQTKKPELLQPAFMRPPKPKDPDQPTYTTDEVAEMLARPRD